MQVETTPTLVENTYRRIEKTLEIVKKRLNRSTFTLAEKIVLGHLDNAETQELERGKSHLLLRPDRVAMQDATAQMALLQFMQAGIPQAAVPSSVHCDHLITGRVNAAKDMVVATTENREVYDFLKSVSNKYGIGFWGPGAGIIHQVVAEKYAYPGGMMIGTDSHTPNAGGLGMIAVGVGGADAVDVMVGMSWEVKYPKLIGVKLLGKPSGWTSGKDVILKLLGQLTTKGGTNCIVEYFGPGTASLSATAKGTITNMGAELGATTSIFPVDQRTLDYLKATNRAEIADLALKYKHLLAADEDVLANPKKYFDQVIEIDLSTLEPHVVGPHSPDVAHPISQLGANAKKNGWTTNVTAALIGSCTNSSYEDLSRAADVVHQVTSHGGKMKAKLWVSPGSEQIHQTIKRDGQLGVFEAAGGTVLANACGPCIGQWQREDIQQGEVNSIVTSFNRNFKARNDGNEGTQAFIASPEITVALGAAGSLDFNPITDTLTDGQGKPYKLLPPGQGGLTVEDLPSKGFVLSDSGYVAPPADGSKVAVDVAPNSERLQLLAPFDNWDGKDFVEFPLLLKAKGKCTTDHISPAGKWLRFRGHLDRISDNMFLGAVNAFSGQAGQVKNLLSGEAGQNISKVARAYKAKGLRWVVVGDENYGEGSSREHAAMCPRFLGAAAVITRSFARIHETNLKKQGILPLTFLSAADYDTVRDDDRLSILGLKDLAPGKDVQCVLKHGDGQTETITLKHSLNAEALEWFKNGGALNLIRQKSK